MFEPLPITEEMRNVRERCIDTLIIRCNSKIRDAFERGNRFCRFPVNMDNPREAECCEEVRKRFETAGYRISKHDKDYSGTEYIFW